MFELHFDCFRHNPICVWMPSVRNCNVMTMKRRSFHQVPKFLCILLQSTNPTAAYHLWERRAELGPTSHSDLVVGPLVPLTLSSMATSWMKVYPSGGGKKGCGFCPKLNSTAQFFTRTWGKRARPASASLVVRKATPSDTPFLEKLISTSSPLSKFCRDKMAGRAF